MAEPPHRKPTSFDVARLAGVSRSAVSRAFTPGANIAPETREKVTKAAKKLGYRVNNLARGLQQSHSGIVGLVASRLDTPLRSRQVRLLSEALIRAGFQPMLLTAEQPDDVAGLIDMLLGYSVAGMIITSDTPPRALIEDCGRLQLPVVLINRAGVSDWGDRVVADIDAGGTLALDMLQKTGAGRFGCLMPVRETWSVTGRAKAFVEAVQGLGRTCRCIQADDQAYGDARRAVVEAGRERMSQIDGLFCSTDLMAFGALDGLRIDLGLRVPQDIQVVGFDDIEQAAWGAYDLTTIRQDLEEQTAIAMRLLRERMADMSVPNRTCDQNLVPVFRGTTRPV
ncbi:LacI family DNA-binding transcriptional regulator [Amaricoccus tamworthensis]|uniref:LacI family DNA-binding transcriptional regulator n=1 Tax=Amaricoccus tamworthensis TaxID=57002 RepID=UPI003C7A80DB